MSTPPPHVEPAPVQVFRLRTSAFCTRKSGLVFTKTLKRVRRHSAGGEWLEDDVDNFGADEVAKRITNLFTVPDGLYRIEITNVTYESVEGYSTNFINDYDYKLEPFSPPAA